MITTGWTAHARCVSGLPAGVSRYHSLSGWAFITTTPGLGLRYRYTTHVACGYPWFCDSSPTTTPDVGSALCPPILFVRCSYGSVIYSLPLTYARFTWFAFVDSYSYIHLWLHRLRILVDFLCLILPHHTGCYTRALQFTVLRCFRPTFCSAPHFQRPC